jgi:hypothetical protein
VLFRSCFFFFWYCLQRAALLIAVDKLSVTLYENSSQPGSLYTGSVVTRERNREGSSDLIVAWFVKTSSIIDSYSIPN